MEHWSYHRGICWVTPGSRFRSEDKAILEARQQVVAAAMGLHPERWVNGKMERMDWIECVALNPDKVAA